jgi:hypothetical protein
VRSGGELSSGRVRTLAARRATPKDKALRAAHNPTGRPNETTALDFPQLQDAVALTCDRSSQLFLGIRREERKPRGAP